MQDTVTWERTTRFTGRNGNFKCSGVELLPHVERCHRQGLLKDKVPVLYQGVDATGSFMQWGTLDSLLPYADMLAEWEKARAEKREAIEQQRQAQIKELRAEIRKTRAEMKERGIKRTSCFNRVDGDTYRLNETMFELETRLKSLLGSEC